MSIRIASTPPRLLLALFATLLGGCVTTVATHPMESGIIGTDGVTIQSAAPVFSLKTGQRFKPPPFRSDCWNLDPEDERALNADGLVEGYNTARKLHAVDVRVTVPGRDKPLHGVLMLCDAADQGTGPGSRSYLIEIPKHYVDEARDDKVTVVYEKQDWRGESGNKISWYGWILWLSERELR